MRIVYAKGFFKRLIGLAFKKNIDYVLVLENCNSIHTFFMKENINIVMTDKNKKIIFMKKNMKKNKIIAPKKGAYYTFEFPTSFSFDYKVGDYIDF